MNFELIFFIAIFVVVIISFFIKASEEDRIEAIKKKNVLKNKQTIKPLPNEQKEKIEPIKENYIPSFRPIDSSAYIYSVESFKEKDTFYTVDLTNLTCTCKDFTKVRSYYEKFEPQRLCKHLIKSISESQYWEHDIDLNYFKNKINEYAEREIGFARNYECDIIEDMKILYTISSAWITIYDSEGNSIVYNGERFVGEESEEIDKRLIETMFLRVDAHDNAKTITIKLNNIFSKLSDEEKEDTLPKEEFLNYVINFEELLSKNTMRASAYIKLPNRRRIDIFNLDTYMWNRNGFCNAYVWVNLDSFYNIVHSLKQEKWWRY